MAISTPETSVDSLMEDYKLTEGVFNAQVTDKHRVDICRSCLGKWRSLPPSLKMLDITADNIDKSNLDEEDKKIEFLKKWKQIKGSSATYRNLVCALLEISCKEDAEFVCKLLQDSEQQQSASTSHETGMNDLPNT